jgi:type IV fimbrial biogenesis protein FimT
VDGWIAFVDANEDGDYDKDDDDTFLRGTMLDGPMGVDVSPAISANKVASVIFRPDGLARNENSGGGPGTGLLDGALRLCIATTRPPNNARDVQIVSGSRIAAVQVDGGGACAAPANP